MEDKRPLKFITCCDLASCIYISKSFVWKGVTDTKEVLDKCYQNEEYRRHILLPGDKTLLSIKFSGFSELVDVKFHTYYIDKKRYYSERKGSEKDRNVDTKDKDKDKDNDKVKINNNNNNNDPRHLNTEVKKEKPLPTPEPVLKTLEKKEKEELVTSKKSLPKVIVLILLYTLYAFFILMVFYKAILNKNISFVNYAFLTELFYFSCFVLAPAILIIIPCFVLTPATLIIFPCSLFMFSLYV